MVDEKMLEYEEYIFKKERIKKEARQNELKYFAIFGAMITELFELQIECIKCKKKIAYCQKKENAGQVAEGRELDEYIENITATYYEQLDNMYKLCGGIGVVCEENQEEIKRLYYKIAKVIHPDLNPMLFDNKEIVELWCKTSVAYKYNDIASLRECEEALMIFLAKNDIGDVSININDIDEKIYAIKKEIADIVSTAPYNYIEVLSDAVALEEKSNILLGKLKQQGNILNTSNRFWDSILFYG